MQTYKNFRPIGAKNTCFAEVKQCCIQLNKLCLPGGDIDATNSLNLLDCTSLIISFQNYDNNEDEKHWHMIY